MSVSIFRSSFALPATATADPTTICPSDLPLVLMPVRLETRFFAQPDGSSELRVRVYPDKIHLDSHEPDLLAVERDAGMQYWDRDWRAASDAAARATAWSQFADRVGAARAAWIARALQPTNLDQRPTTPVAPDVALSPAIAFPIVTVVSDPQAAAWRHAPQARLMPDRWIAILNSGATTIQATGKDIVRPVAVGPDPSIAPGSTPLDQLGIDAGMKWMVDFGEAELKGMALRISVPAAVMAVGIDSLVVFGVSASLNGSDGAAQLATLLDAHHYTDGLDFLRFGTPTNNTDDRRAPQLTDDAGHARSFGLEVSTDPSKFDARSNALRVGTAFGLPPASHAAVLGHVGQAGDQHETSMRSMNAALWQVGWGYYLTNIIGFFGNTGLTPEVLVWARDHFVSHVRAGGPFPILRAGRQPYGVLPVTSLDLWKPRVGDEQLLAHDESLRGLLIKLRDLVWRPRLGETFRLGRRTTLNGPHPDADLADVMRTDAVSSGYNTRGILGRHYLQHLRAFLNEDISGGFVAAEDAWAGTLPQKLGFTWRPRIARAVGAELSWPVTGPLVQAGEVSPWRSLEPNYIGTLLTQKVSDLTISLDPAGPNAPKSLLEALLRHALRREIANATANLASRSVGTPVPLLITEPELNDLVTDAPLTQHWKRQLDQPSPDVPGSTIHAQLDGLTGFDGAGVTDLGDFRKSLAFLQGLDSEMLQYLMQGTLDLSSHRLDAWITSYATKRLAAMRNASLTGVYVGAYGWVENLRAALPTTAIPVATPPVDEPGPLVAAVNDSGFIHAPSMTHAAAAAVLRNAHLGATGVPQPTSPFAIDLSSARVREADRLLDGVRNGQPLGALLGYRLERSLHDLSVDVAIPKLRSLAPLVPPQTVDANTPTDAIAANNVVDGLTLFRMWDQDRAGVMASLSGVVPSAKMGNVMAELDTLAATIDGLGDALTAEAAYQIARGNTSRAGATLASIAKGDAPPPDLEVARTPRSGTSLTHRLMVLFSGTTNLSNPGWPAWNTGTISLAEPLLNYWASRILGNPGLIRCTVERIDDATGAVVETLAFPLKELGIQPLDVLYGVEVSANSSAAQPVGSLSYIEQYVLFQAKRRTPGFAATATIRLQHARPTNLAAGEITLFDMLEQAKALRRTLASARGVDPEDLSPPDRSALGSVDLVELEARVVRAENALNAAHKALVTLIAPKATPTAESLRLALLKLGIFAIGPAVPVNATGEDPASIAALVAQAAVLVRVSGARNDQIIANRALPVAIDPRARLDQLTARMRLVFGQSFVTLPHFTLVAAGATELASALAESKQALGGDTLAANSWLAKYARVRDTVGRFNTCLRGADVLGTGEKLNLGVAQLPFTSGERWVGLPPVPGTPLASGKISLVVQTCMPINTTLVMTGLLVDEWTEVVPNDRETTAITFQFDPPNAMAPQSILVAVPPVPGVDWTVDTLRRVLAETLDLAKLRAVDAELLAETAQYLPAIYTAFNINDDAVSTDFAPLTQDLPQQALGVAR